jgi:hypothetical protein
VIRLRRTRSVWQGHDRGKARLRAPAAPGPCGPLDLGRVPEKHCQTVIGDIIRLALVLVAGLAFSVSASAQDKKADAQLRTIHGSVLDKAETPIAGSVVYLLNVKSQAVKTYIADEAGAYRFSGLDPNSDYEVHAEHVDLVSATRTVSMYDSRRDVEIILKLNHKKTDH